MFVNFWIFLVGVAVWSTTGQAWGPRRHRFGPPHNDFGPPHYNFGPPHRGGGRPPYHPWHHDSNESPDWSSSGSGSWSGSDESGGWNFPCHDHENPRWPPKPKPTPRPTPKPSPGPNPNPETQPTPGPFPQPTPTPAPQPTPGPFPQPTPGRFPQPTPGPFPQPTPGRFPQPTTGPLPQPTPRPSPQPTPGPFPTPTPFPTPSPKQPDLQGCLRSCPVTSEYNPVCGTDGVTYTNPGRLECAKMCGVDVQLSRNSRCPTNGGGTTSPPISPQPDVQACIRNCPVTSEYNPVCGTDGVTYSNLGRLECARMCGVAVTIGRMSRCPAPQPTSNPITNPTPTPTPTLPFREPMTPSPTPSVGPVTVPTSPGLDFTIDQGLLDQIFTTEGPDLTGLIDERNQDNK